MFMKEKMVFIKICTKKEMMMSLNLIQMRNNFQPLNKTLKELWNGNILLRNKVFNIYIEFL